MQLPSISVLGANFDHPERPARSQIGGGVFQTAILLDRAAKLSRRPATISSWVPASQENGSDHITLNGTVSVAVLPSMGLRSFSDALIWQLMLMPNGIENAAAARKTKAENPGEIPH